MAILDEFTSADLIKHLLVKALKDGVDKEVVDAALRFVDHVDGLAIKNLKKHGLTGADFSMSHIRSLFKVVNYCLEKVADDFCKVSQINILDIFDGVKEQYKEPQE